jgi:serine protease Do
MRIHKFIWITLLTVLTTPTLFAVSGNNKVAEQGASLLEQTSKAFTRIAKKSMPATVFIKAEIQNDQHQQHSDPFQDDFFRRFFGEQSPFGRPQEPLIQTASGSGFIIRENGYIVTNHHVVKDAKKITVLLNDGREYEAIIQGTDHRTDLAVLKIEEDDLPYLTFGSSDELEVGEWVIAIGNPFGLEASLTVGVVSAKGRQDLGIASFEDFIQTDAAINPGNSGGPLLNLQSEVVGVNTAIMSRTGGYMGIGLSIPSKMAENIVEQIIDEGTVKRAYIGIVLQSVDKELAQAAGLEKPEGILISEVIKDTPGERAGLLQGDVIISYNKKPAKNVTKFRNEVALMTPSAKISLQIIRNGKEITVPVILGEQKDESLATTEAIQKIGIEIEPITPELSAKIGVPSDLEGVVITKVKPGSSAREAGLKPGYVIIGVAVNWNNQKRIKNLDEFTEAMEELGDKKHIILIVRHQNFQRYYTLKIN